MGALVLIFGCLGLGIFLQHVPAFPKDAHQGLTGFLLYISLPAITLRYIPELPITWDLLFPAGIAWIIFPIAFVLFSLLGKWLNWSKETTGCLVLVAGLGNTSFVGFPLIESFYGSDGLQYAVLCDQPGSFLVLTTLGIAAMGYFLTGSRKLSSIGRELFKFPPFPAFLLALALMISGAGIPDILKGPLETLGNTLSPIALVAIGLQLRNPFRKSSDWAPLGIGLVFKLLIAPSIISLLYLRTFGLEGLVADVSILEAAMPPMITPAIIAMDKGLNPPLASLLIAVGIPIGIATVFGWYFLLQYLM